MKKYTYMILIQALLMASSIGSNVWSLLSDDWLSARNDTIEQGLMITCITNERNKTCDSMCK